MKTCKVIIKDEVNAKLEGLELSDRKTLMKMFEFEIPGARYLPSVRLGRWNGKVSYFTLGGSTYINLLAEIIPFLDKQGYDIELDDTREYNAAIRLDNKVSVDTFKNYKWPKGHVKAGEPIELRDYQVQVINDFLANPQSIQEVATGAGKTITTAALSYSVQNYGRSIIIVPNKSLVVQTEEDYINVGLDVGVYFGDRKEYGKKHTICTWQSLNNLLKSAKEEGNEIVEDFFMDIVCVIVDEVHMAKADVLKSMLTGVLSKVPIRWGLTGTVPKGKFEFQSLFVSLGPVIGKLSASQLQDKGVLAQCHVNIVQLQDDVEFNNYQSELKFLTENEKRLDAIADLINKVKDSGNTLILVDRISAGKLIQQKLNSLLEKSGEKTDVAFISGEMKITERKEEYDEVAISAKKIIVATYGVAAVGINIPRIFNLVLLEPGKSFVRVIQSIGRGIRKAEDKDFVQIWDVTSNCRFAKRHLTQRKSFYKEALYPFDSEKLTYR